MVSKNQLKLIKSLHQKKYRNEHGLFFIEGVKAITELLNSGINLHQILTTRNFSSSTNLGKTVEITNSDLKKISAFQNPSGDLAVFEIPKPKQIDFDDWIVVLDDIRDPGNLGTIIRLCDWFGIKNLVCSKETVDCYNPKVLQATMGSIARINIAYRDLKLFLSKASTPIYGSFMRGNSIYKEVYPKAGILILGNEANGISTKLDGFIKQRITIPQFGDKSTESLNVATATAIMLSEVRREN